MSVATLFVARSFSLFLVSCFLSTFVNAFDNSRSDNLAVYWGQDSYGAVNPSASNQQQRLADYCNDDVIDAFPVAFVNVFFGADGLPGLDLGNTCGVGGNGAFTGTDLPKCTFLASDIKTCQSKGKIVTLSLGGGGASVGLSSDSQAEQLADNIWNEFLGGSSSTRPFGDAVLDGIDLDIEGGSPAHYSALVSRIRSHAEGASKKYYVTGAPQCPFPDANMGETLNAVAFDAVYVQFYNNYCGLQAFNDPNSWNFATWDHWAKTQAPNKDVKIYIGAPASSSAAGSGYVSASTFANIIKETQSKYSSFGGVMLWDASQAYANNRYDKAVKEAMSGGSAPAPPPSSSSSTHHSTSTAHPTSTTHKVTSTTKASHSSSASPKPTSTSCGSVKGWNSTEIYLVGNSVSFEGHVWEAKWWTQGDNPEDSGEWGVWADKGACGSSGKKRMVRRHAGSIGHGGSAGARAHGHIRVAVPENVSSEENVAEEQTVLEPQVKAQEMEIPFNTIESEADIVNSRLFRL